jgi:hypothetical protein
MPIPGSDRVESATFAKLLTIIFGTDEAENLARHTNYRMGHSKIRAPSVHGGASNLLNLLKYYTESNNLSAYGR